MNRNHSLSLVLKFDGWTECVLDLRLVNLTCFEKA